MSVVTEREVQHAAHLILVTGRYYAQPMSRELIAQGTRALITNPAYRRSVYASAMKRAAETHDGLLLLSLSGALSTLEINDMEDDE